MAVQICNLNLFVLHVYERGYMCAQCTHEGQRTVLGVSSPLLPW